MKRPNYQAHRGILLAAGAALLLSACPDSDLVKKATPPASVTQAYTVTVTNLTANQPFSPVALLQHSDAFTAWQAGSSASVALEKLAEGGNAADFDSETGVNARVSDTAPLGPGEQTKLSFELDAKDAAYLTVATMLVNTNDAFTGVSRVDLTKLPVYVPKTYRTKAYDAGTEGNSEARGTMPGPADGGEGFNAERNDVNRVYVHAGVISADDGFTTSVLSASHRFDNPVALITVTRTK
ncbi:hypothetical protein NFHSH190041_33360 [Shewanella sp. NFH-SH190041]|uniref:spondin domain-containing protein n=1 Tax=Shewanella sp. NFH-SH190041 TaxID=2950245 RepID=UPI0021C43358|nr:spondin domain-containing protein [Shewanella sp. NFH-SH190041]BDM65884.1 hypothetical protein NFHSH190041_33360 [Shewanella sp. NFH-SH190041]